jgi:hypothetical protein
VLAPGHVIATDKDLIDAAATRAQLGLDASLERVASLKESSADVGSDSWGIPMTAAEAAEIDLPGRMDFADRVDQHAREYLESLPGYAGHYFDQADGGRLTVNVTDNGSSVADELGRLLGDSKFAFGTALVDDSMKALMAALDSASGAVERLAPGRVLMSSGLNVRGNAIFLGFDKESMASGIPVAALSEALGVDVEIRVASYEDPAACGAGADRDHCTAPMKAGIFIYDNSGGCTMGFHVIRPGGDKQFVTAGHCGWNSAPAYFHTGYMNGTVKIGDEVDTVYHQNGQDIQRVTLVANHETDLIFDQAGDVTGSGGTPQDGEVLCASLGVTDNVVCAVVTEPWISYSFSAEWGGFDLWGGDMAFNPTGGNSGSPIYRINSGNSLRAIGVLSSQSGHFARLDQSLDDLSVSIYVGN